ncbi:MAG TPA: hypothetical protein PLQ57_12490 [Saprospiraceae bacterium]|mgnify:CR=1 FL=1|nr:hypothetical protein [Saprospiraceae bacterium]
MQQPTPTLLIDNPGLIIESKFGLLELRNGFQLVFSLLIIIYKRLNTSGCRRVLSGEKRLTTDIGFDSQIFKEVCGIADMGGVRIWVGCGYKKVVLNVKRIIW